MISRKFDSRWWHHYNSTKSQSQKKAHVATGLIAFLVLVSGQDDGLLVVGLTLRLVALGPVVGTLVGFGLGVRLFLLGTC